MAEIMLATVLIAPMAVGFIRWLMSWKCRICSKFFGDVMYFSVGELVGSIFYPRSRVCAWCAMRYGKSDNDTVI